MKRKNHMLWAAAIRAAIGGGIAFLHTRSSEPGTAAGAAAPNPPSQPPADTSAPSAVPDRP